jgi:hypothetical protein
MVLTRPARNHKEERSSREFNSSAKEEIAKIYFKNEFSRVACTSTHNSDWLLCMREQYICNKIPSQPAAGRTYLFQIGYR